MSEFFFGQLPMLSWHLRFCWHWSIWSLSSVLIVNTNLLHIFDVTEACHLSFSVQLEASANGFFVVTWSMMLMESPDNWLTLGFLQMGKGYYLGLQRSLKQEQVDIWRKCIRILVRIFFWSVILGFLFQHSETIVLAWFFFFRSP